MTDYDTFYKIVCIVYNSPNKTVTSIISKIVDQGISTTSRIASLYLDDCIYNGYLKYRVLSYYLHNRSAILSVTIKGLDRLTINHYSILLEKKDS